MLKQEAPYLQLQILQLGWRSTLPFPSVPYLCAPALLIKTGTPIKPGSEKWVLLSGLYSVKQHCHAEEIGLLHCSNLFRISHIMR